MVCAGSLLLNSCVIVGGGRFVATRAALLAGQVQRITVVELEEYMIERYAPIEPSNGKIKLDIVRADLMDYTPPYPASSLFYDPFPRVERGPARCAKWLKPGGRLVFLTPIHSIKEFPGEWIFKFSADPLRCQDQLAVYQKAY